MPIPILATKLFIPPSGSCRVERARLSIQLDECLRADCRLALLSAPAGFGKTTLVSAWIRAAQSSQNHLAAAWLSLDEQDNDLNRFWTYVVAAFQTIDPQFGKEALTLLSTGLIHNPEPILTILINYLSSFASPFVLVLDDFHLIAQEAILKSVAFLLDRLPPNGHVMILTRSDPHLPLARFRARGQLVEIRLSNLRFSLAEAGEFLNTAMGLNLAPAPVESLHARTEGWIAGLQMAALSLRDTAREAAASQNRDMMEEFVASFSGSNRYILDYLLDEVLRRQPVEVQDFLLKTSILERFCAPLCDAILEPQMQSDKSERGLLLMSGEFQPILEYVEQENLFLIPLDAERRWYRYHQLFADLLKKRMRKAHPAEVLALHALASQWYEENHLPHQAVEHAFLALDFARAGKLLEETGETILKHGEYQWLLQWIQKLPREQIQTHWKLYLYLATVYASVGQLIQAEQCLQAFEQCRLGNCDEELHDWLAGCVAAVQALIAIFRGDAATARRNACLALETIPGGSASPWRPHLLIALSHINQVDGNLINARQNLIDAIEAGKQAGDIYMTLDATTHLVMMLCTQGQLRQAGEFAQQGLQYIEQFGLDNSTEASMLFLGWGFILCERHRLDEAGKYIQRGFETCRQANIPGMLGWAYQVTIRYLIAKGDWPAAEEAARKADQLTKEVEIPVWIKRGCSAMRAQVWIRQGKFAEAEQYLHERGIIPMTDLKVIEHMEDVSLGRLLLMKGDLDIAEQLIGQLLQRAEGKGHQRLVIQNLVYLALLYDARGNRQMAVQSLAHALEQAEPEGYIQLFLDEGVSLSDLLGAAAKLSKNAVFAQSLLSALMKTKDRPILNDNARPVEMRPECAGDDAALSQREREVLRLLAEGLSNKEIAQRLYITLRTVKYHTTNIFTKLSVDNRTQAVLQAKTLNIL